MNLVYRFSKQQFWNTTLADREQFGIDIACIDDMALWQEALRLQGCMNGGGGFAVVDGRRGRHHVRDQGGASALYTVCSNVLPSAPMTSANACRLVELSGRRECAKRGP
jgi:hypothetical protein